MVRAGLTPAAAYAALGWRGVAEDGSPIGEAPPERTLAARLAQLLDRCAARSRLDALLAARARADREAELARESALAGPRLSARILALLPPAGVALAVAVDARVLSVLASPLGIALIAVAGALTLAGRVWIRRMVRQAGGPEVSSVSPAIATALRAVIQAGQDIPGALRAVGSALGADVSATATASAASATSTTAAIGTTGATSATGTTTGAGLARAGAALRRGDTWDEAWAAVPEEVAILARALWLPWTRGAAAGPMLAAAADELALSRRARSTRAAGELGVRLALPLALCLLPAFVVGGVVPLLVALVAGLW